MNYLGSNKFLSKIITKTIIRNMYYTHSQKIRNQTNFVNIIHKWLKG